jgi:hypothetical protein
MPFLAWPLQPRRYAMVPGLVFFGIVAVVSLVHYVRQQRQVD